MSSKMRSFWDRRADEDAFFFVDSRMDYRNPDLDRFWANGEKDLDALLLALGESLRPDYRVVEIGCGVGRLTRVISARAASVQALDVSQRMLELARQYNEGLDNVEWILGDGASLNGIEPESADACISHVVFQHIPDPLVTLGYIREIGRVLRPGGWTAFQFSNRPPMDEGRSAWGRARDGVLAALGRVPKGQHDLHWSPSLVELDDLREVAAASSLDIEQIIGEGTRYCCVLARRRDTRDR